MKHINLSALLKRYLSDGTASYPISCTEYQSGYSVLWKWRGIIFHTPEHRHMFRRTSICL